jgi:uncharacterized protein YprB with RNaseH-like and TPR domain
MSLLDRLAHARVLDRPPVASAPSIARPPASPPPIARASIGAAFERRERFIELDPHPSVGRARGFAQLAGSLAGERSSLLGGCLERVSFPGVAALARDLVCLGAREGGRAVFLDLETTGLGGACVPFVVGVAWIEASRLHCTQWTLARCSGEAELLADVLARLEAHGPAPLVTFNGTSFDVPLLRLRAHRYGLSARVLDATHLDLLHPARRLHRGRGRDCRLSTLERELLGIRRSGDIDSAEIPGVFWTWVQSPSDVRAQRRLQAVCDHNLVDIVSLPALAAWLADAVREPGDLDRALRAARLLDRVGAAEQARLVLSRWLELSSRPLVDKHAGARWREAALELASLERRAGERERAAELLRAAWSSDPGCPDASEAWAKVLEHQLGDFAQALRVARGSRQPCERRIARLEARLARAGRGRDPKPAAQPVEPEPIAAPVRHPPVERAPVPIAPQVAPPVLPLLPKPELRPDRAAELLARIDQTEAGAVVRYRLLR